MRYIVQTMGMSTEEAERFVVEAKYGGTPYWKDGVAFIGNPQSWADNEVIFLGTDVAYIVAEDNLQAEGEDEEMPDA